MKPDNDDLRLLSKSAAATRLGIGKTSLNKLIDQGRIRVIILENQIKISVLELKRFIEESASSFSDSENYSNNKPLYNLRSNKKDKTSMKGLNTNLIFNQIMKENLNGDSI